MSIIAPILKYAFACRHEYQIPLGKSITPAQCSKWTELRSGTERGGGQTLLKKTSLLKITPYLFKKINELYFNSMAIVLTLSSFRIY